MKFTDLKNMMFKGNVSSLSDVLPCPRCNSLKIKSAPRADVPYYERRYECKECGQGFRYDTRPVDDAPQEVIARTQRDSKLILPR